MTQHEKYRVIRKLDAGGMAEVFVGEAESLQGFKKRVAIKRVLPHLVENRKFLAMFLDEARLSLRLTHANVVQVFDIGRSGETYFIVMEYVDGSNLKKVMEDIRTRGEFMPVELACWIVTEICRGLDYAHTFKDHEGNELNIVHRDVSPPNVLLSKQGEVKIVDFGLAKATSQLEHTDPGVVKGKFAYLAPEAAWGKGVDLRADVFACGVILWELLASQRLFLGKSDVETIELVRRTDVPSLSGINPKVPEALEEIVRKTLAARAEDRYSSCSELAEALAGFLFEYGLKVTSFDLQRLVRQVASKEEQRKKTSKPSIIDQLIQEELIRFSSLDDKDFGTADPDREETGAHALDPAGFHSVVIDQAEIDRGQPSTPPRPESTPPPRKSQPPAENSSLAHILEGDGRLAPTQENNAAKQRNRLFFALVVVATLSAVFAATAAFFLGWIP